MPCSTIPCSSVAATPQPAEPAPAICRHGWCKMVSVSTRCCGEKVSVVVLCNSEVSGLYVKHNRQIIPFDPTCPRPKHTKYLIRLRTSIRSSFKSWYVLSWLRIADRMPPRVTAPVP